MQPTKYNVQYVPYYSSQTIDVPKTANGYFAVNKGDTLVIVNGFPLLPRLASDVSGESVGVSGNKDEIFVGLNNSMLIQVTPAGAGHSAVVWIGWKYYIDEC